VCGLAGILPNDTNAIYDMGKALKRRGPDMEGLKVTPEIGVYHSRLSIQGLSYDFRQPLKDKRYTLLFNGEIYNFKGENDTEYLLKLWKKKGIDCLNDLNGQFAFAVYDNKEKKLTLVRDRFGIKPLYYTFRDNTFYFASEIKAFKGLFPLEVDQQGLFDLMAYRASTGETTLFKDIKRLEAGKYLTFTPPKKGEKQIKVFEWYDKSYMIQKGEEIRDLSLLKDCVERRMISDVEVGVLMSGGVDSTLIAALSGAKKTFTLGTQELQASLDMTSRYSLDSYWVSGKVKVEQMVYDWEQPYYSFSPGWICADFIKRKGIKVILNGLGPDELMDGYGLYGKKYHQVPNVFPEAWKMFDIDEESRAISDQYHPIGVENNHYNLNRGMVTHYLSQHHLQTQDKIFGAFGLEARYPYLDHEFVELCFSLPEKVKKNKAILRAFAKPFIPESCLNQKKMGFVFDHSPYWEQIEDEWRSLDYFGKIEPKDNRQKIFYALLNVWLKIYF
jgi:asparagine synthase (glutamine-hydrolysing)